MIKRVLIGLLFTWLIYSSNILDAQPAKMCRISGQVKGFKESSLIYLDNGHGRVVDSARIMGGRFFFKIKLDEPAQQLVLINKNGGNYRFFWAEPGDVTFMAEKGHFSRAKVTGSKTELISQRLDASVAPMRHALDTVTTDASFKRANNRLNEAYVKFTSQNPGSLISANLLSGNMSEIGRERARKLYHAFTPLVKSSADGKAILQFITLNKDVSVGKPFVDITQFTAEGRPLKLSAYKGHVTLLDFWASWCHPCRQENPNLVKCYNKYKGKGFKIFAVSVDTDKKDWLAAVKKDGLIYTNVSEKNGGTNTADIVYGINQYPSNYLIDKNGLIVAKDLRSAELEKMLNKLMR